MILGYVSGVDANSVEPQLCIVADNPSAYTIPVRVDSLISTDAAIHLISNTEGILVERGEGPQKIVITPAKPSRLYLTLNLHDRPGFSVDRVEVEALGDGRHRVRFDRGREWEKWEPNIRTF